MVLIGVFTLASFRLHLMIGGRIDAKIVPHAAFTVLINLLVGKHKCLIMMKVTAVYQGY